MMESTPASEEGMTLSQRALGAALSSTLSGALSGRTITPEDALAVLCSMAANLISTDPDLEHQHDAVEAFSAVLGAETARLRECRIAMEPHYRAAAQATVKAES